MLSAAVRTCLEAPLHTRLDRREIVSLALVADASAERAEKVRTNTHSHTSAQTAVPRSPAAEPGRWLHGLQSN